MMLIVKVGGSMLYQVLVLTLTNYPMGAIKVNIISKEVKTRSFFVSSDTRRHGVANGKLHLPKASVGWAKNMLLGCGSRENGSTCNLIEEAWKFAYGGGNVSGLALKAMSLGYELEDMDLIKRLLDSMPKYFQ
uniref:Uncharacterized protein n=1 Tax=Lactuca sativa TaxID=4236 RepID=A0A9R1W4I6_LACSA|nr:hypothetical protein LSAT_V11C300144340 [Lactuca sativa]